MIVVTGGAGMIGSNLVHALNRLGERDILLVDDLSDGRKVVNIADLEIADYEDMDRLFARLDSGPAPRAVFHLGACSRTTETDGRFMMRVNYLYSRALLGICLERSIPLVYASSAAVYGSGSAFREEPSCERPLNIYAYSKLLFDRYVRHNVPPDGPPVCGLRYFNVYGPRESHKDDMASVVFHLHNQIMSGANPRLFGAHDGYEAGEQARDFIHVDDAVDVTLWCWQAGVSGVFNCGTGRAGTFRALAEAVIEAHGRGEIEYIDFPGHLKGRYQSFTEADLTRLRAAGFEGTFRDVASGTGDYVSWLKNAPS
jgi:ADP-L-glycero-D-manno-heptose 6-epimerase